MRFAFFQKTSFRYAAAGFAVAIIGYAGYSVGVPVAHEFADSFAMKEFKQYGVLGTYHKHFFTFFDKISAFTELETENERLRSEVALLEQKQTLEESDRAERELASMNELLQKKVKEQGGSEEARLPQTLAYELPVHLLPSQLYPLALAYFRKQEFEKTAVIMEHLFKLPEDRRYETAENYLISGISWYHLKNYTEARKQVSEANQRSHVSATAHRQSLLWEAMIERAEGKTKLAQAKLLHFIGEYPHATESSWINGGRAPARATEGHEIPVHANLGAHQEPARNVSEVKHEDEPAEHSEAVKGHQKEEEHHEE